MEKTTSGWINGFIGVAIFAGSLPATRVAVAAFEPTFLTCARASIAGLLGALVLILLRQPRPQRADLLPLAVTALGVVIGFPLLTALALQHISSAHSIVFVGLLPLCTAGFAVLRGGSGRGRCSGCSRLQVPGWSQATHCSMAPKRRQAVTC